MESFIKNLFTTDILREALERFSMPEESIAQLDGFENFIFEGYYQDQPAILRLSHSSKKDESNVQSELAFIDYLSAHHAAVARPNLSYRGLLTEQICLPDGSYFTAVCFEKAPGRHPQNGDYNETLFGLWGAAMGRLHHLSRHYSVPANLERIHWYEEVEITRAEEFLPADQWKVVEKLHNLVATLNQLPVDRKSYGVIHNDLHPYNFLYDGKQITMIDFEDSVKMWYLADIATSLFMVTVWPPNRISQENFVFAFLPDFLDGYRKESDLSSGWEDQMNLFLKFREIGQYIAMYRACNMDHLDPWPAYFLKNRRERIENDVPFLDLDWKQFV